MRKISAVAALVFSFTLAGCSSFAPPPEEAGIVEIAVVQKEHSPAIYFVYAYRASDEIVVRGRLKHPVWSWFGMFPGHIDLTVNRPDAKRITLHDIAVHPRRIPEKRGREAFFVARLATDIPVGTELAVEYTEEDHGRPF
tara:strand:+ start:511 stop:930 length:420 start_codon:yes stop_codon:yes gene_type:complete